MSQVILSVPPVRSLDADAAASYVLGRQTRAGGFCFYRTPGWGVDEPNALDTLAALESLRLLGRDVPEPARVLAWLLSLQEDGGGFATLPIGWAALRSLQLLNAEPPRSPLDWAAGWVRRLLDRCQTPDWRAALSGLLQLAELMPLAGLALEHAQQRALAELVEMARMPGSGWTRDGVELESTATALRVLELAGLPIADPEPLTRLLLRCQDRALGLRLAPDTGATSTAALCAGLVLARMLAIQPRYPDAIAASILLLQRSDGGLGARHFAISTLHDTWLGLQAKHLLDEFQEARP